jgi:hypothetical protein
MALGPCMNTGRARRMATLKAIAFGSMAILVLAEHAQGQQCLHRSDESAKERLRRQAAVKFVDDVNVAQARRQRETGRYASLADIQAATAPLGFVPRLVLDQFGYAIKVIDALDPCGFALFSDERAVVFEAHPTAVERQTPEAPPPSQAPGDDGARQSASDR